MLTIVNEGPSLMIVNETTNFIITVVFGNTIVLFSIFRRRFHNETIIFQKKKKTLTSLTMIPPTVKR